MSFSDGSDYKRRYGATWRRLYPAITDQELQAQCDWAWCDSRGGEPEVEAQFDHDWDRGLYSRQTSKANHDD